MVFLKVLGGLSLDAPGAPLSGAARQRRPLALLALLAAAGRHAISRDKLLAILWPERDTEHARHLLKQACYTLRRDLGAPELFLGTMELRLNPDVVHSDLAAVEAALDRDDLAQAVAAYTGPFLDGFYLSGADEFERVVQETRAGLERRVTTALETLATAADATGDCRAAVRWWRRLADIDPLSARAALGLLRALNANRERAAALEFGRVHEALLRSELETVPDSAVRELLERLREDRADRPAPEPLPILVQLGGSADLVPDANARPASPAPAPIAPPASGFSRRLGIVTVALIAVVAVASYAASTTPSRTDPFLVAVQPFDIVGRDIAYAQDGIVNMLVRGIDGGGPFRAVAIGLEDGRTSAYRSRIVPSRGAGYRRAALELSGELHSSGADSIRLKAVIRDVAADRTVAEFDRTELADRIDRLADSVSLDVIWALNPAPLRAALSRTRPGGDRPPAIRPRSLPALKAFMHGEWHLRRLAFDSAIASFQRAVALDTAFAPAIRRIGVARTWSFQPAAAEYLARAARFNHGWTELDSLLIAADSQPLGDQLPSLHAFVHRKYGVLFEATNRHPENAEAWFEISDLRFHYGFIIGATPSATRGDFDRAIELDPTFGLPYIHAIELALSVNDTAGARRYIEGYLSIPSVVPDAAGMRLLGMLLDRDRVPKRVLDRELRAASPSELRRIVAAVRSWPDPHETQIDIARRLLAAAKAGAPGTGAGASPYSYRAYESILVDALIFRGRLREARELVGDRLVMQGFMELAHLGRIPPAVVDSVIARGMIAPHTGDHLIRPAVAEAACYREVAIGLWWASQRDTASLRRLIVSDSIAVRVPGAQYSPDARPMPGFARAALALARGDSAEALRRFLEIRPRCLDPRQIREMRFSLLVAAGRDAEAIDVFDSSFDRRVPMILERARIAERGGDRRTARQHYEFVVHAWRHADPELRPVVDEARAALERLAEPRLADSQSRSDAPA